MGRGTTGRILAELFVCAALFALAGAADANGVPVDVYLSYLPRQSNWGPQNAQGKAHVEVADGHIVVDVVGLPKLRDEHYAIWLESRAVGTGGQRSLYSVGEFNANDTGEAHFKGDLDVPNQEYRMLFLSVEGDGSRPISPDARRSLAGMFPNKTVTATPAPQLIGATGNQAGTNPGSATAAPTTSTGGTPVAGSSAGVGGNAAGGRGENELERPPYLPVTGISRRPASALVPLVALATLAASAGLTAAFRRGRE